MMARLRCAVRDTWDALISTRRSIAGGRSRGKEVISGLAGRVIIVKSPDPFYFKEAIFIMRDDLFAPEGIDSKAILAEARRAAADYVAERTPPRSLQALIRILFILLGAFVCTALMILFGL